MYALNAYVYRTEKLETIPKPAMAMAISGLQPRTGMQYG